MYSLANVEWILLNTASSDATQKPLSPRTLRLNPELLESYNDIKSCQQLGYIPFTLGNITSTQGYIQVQIRELQPRTRTYVPSVAQEEHIIQQDP